MNELLLRDQLQKYSVDLILYRYDSLNNSVPRRYKVAHFGAPGSAPNQPALKMSIKGKFK